jgi:hypothetical protein
MRVAIPTTVVNGVECTQADFSVSISSGIAARFIPVDDNGAQFTDNEIQFYGALGDPRAEQFMAAVLAAAATLIS